MQISIMQSLDQALIGALFGDGWKITRRGPFERRYSHDRQNKNLLKSAKGRSTKA